MPSCLISRSPNRFLTNFFQHIDMIRSRKLVRNPHLLMTDLVEIVNLDPALRRLMEQTLFRNDGDGDPAVIETAMTDLSRELDYFENALQNDYFAGGISATDFAIYPLLALIRRIHERLPQLGAGSLIGPKLAGFMQRIEQLPYFLKTYPPHWKG